MLRSHVRNDNEFQTHLWEEGERLVEHAKSFTATVARAHVAAEARNEEIYEESCHFERGHLERQRGFEVGVAKGAAAAGIEFQFSSLSRGSSFSSASY